jgi:23S rRNA (cytidine2498-2'-O)-methyltransferase
VVALAQYLAICDKRFFKSAIAELRKSELVDTGSIKRIYDREVFLVNSKDNQKTNPDLALEDFEFFDFVVKIDKAIVFSKNYAEIAKSVSEAVDKGKKFKIYVKKYESESAERAKDIEVAIGTEMERMGFLADLKKPEIAIFLVFLGDKIFIGKSAVGELERPKIIDWFRPSNVDDKDIGLNRASFKIAEAFNYFKVNPSKIKVAIDIGAAPGGWSYYLASKDIKVIAIDNALMDYETLCEKFKVIVISKISRGSAESIQNTIIGNGLKDVHRKNLSVSNIEIHQAQTMADLLKSYDIVQIKAPAEEAEKYMAYLKALHPGLLAIDINVKPKYGIETAKKFSQALDPEGIIITTLKFATMDTAGTISYAKNSMEDVANAIKIKKLPHNRKELTLFAYKK